MEFPVWEDLIRIRGNNFKLIQHHCHYDLGKFNFTITNRVGLIWNSLCSHVHVVSADTINTFKDRLDKFWVLCTETELPTLYSM